MAELGRKKEKEKTTGTERMNLRGYHRQPRCMSEKAA
jgi:hypothetical protein